jgi:hypothetical protein
LAIVTSRVDSVVKQIPATEEQKSAPITPGPIQGGGTQPMQLPQQQAPQTPQQ